MAGKAKNAAFDSIKQGLEEALAYAEGKPRPGTRVTQIEIVPPTEYSAGEIKALRLRTSLTQEMFAETLGVTKKAVEAWEAGRNTPAGPALRMMNIMTEDPHILEKHGILKNKSERPKAERKRA